MDDPVYSQSPASNVTQINDPVYAQPQSSPAVPGHPASSSGVGTISPAQDPVYSQSKTASNRLNQLTSQLATQQGEPQANTKRSRKGKSKSNDPAADLPADYSDILEQLATLKTIAATPDPSNRGYLRQKTSGKLWARERIAALLDADSWRELGSVTGTAEWRTDAHNPQREHVESFTPSNNPQGFGSVTCPRTGQRRQIYLTADDFSIRSGHADGSVALKTVHGEKLALRLKVPVVKLVDGSSGGGSVSTIKTNGWSYLPHLTVLAPVIKQLNAGIPNLGAVLGPAIGLGAARVVSTHFSVMAADVGSLFNAGPKVVEGATFEEGLTLADLGGPAVHCTNGTIDNMAADERECFDQIRTVLAYLPDCGMYQAPPVLSRVDDDVHREDLALRSIIPRRKNRMYNPYAIIESVVDRASWFEIGRLWGRTGITGLARMGGRPVGILSMNCEVNSGALDALGSQKLMKMIKFCDVFNLPIVQFVDIRKSCLHPVLYTYFSLFPFQVMLTAPSWLRNRHRGRTSRHHEMGRRARQGLLLDHDTHLLRHHPPRLRRRRRHHARLPRPLDAHRLAQRQLGQPPPRRRHRGRPPPRTAADWRQGGARGRQEAVQGARGRLCSPHEPGEDRPAVWRRGDCRSQGHQADCVSVGQGDVWRRYAGEAGGESSWEVACRLYLILTDPRPDRRDTPDQPFFLSASTSSSPLGAFLVSSIRPMPCSVRYTSVPQPNMLCTAMPPPKYSA